MSLKQQLISSLIRLWIFYHFIFCITPSKLKLKVKQIQKCWSSFGMYIVYHIKCWGFEPGISSFGNFWLFDLVWTGGWLIDGFCDCCFCFGSFGLFWKVDWLIILIDSFVLILFGWMIDWLIIWLIVCTFDLVWLYDWLIVPLTDGLHIWFGLNDWLIGSWCWFSLPAPVDVIPTWNQRSSIYSLCSPILYLIDQFLPGSTMLACCHLCCWLRGWGKGEGVGGG